MNANKTTLDNFGQSRNYPLDFIRFLAIMSIIFFHYNCDLAQLISQEKVMWKNYGYASNFGVSLFFILSGSSLMLSSKDKYSVTNFYKKRFFSIYPLFWGVYILVAILYVIFCPSNFLYGKWPGSFVLTIIGLDGFLLYKIPNYYLLGEWFLGCIVIIYLIFPVIRYFYSVNRNLFIGFLFVCTFLLEKIYSLGMPIERFPLFRLFEFAAGMYLIDIYRDYACCKKNFILLAALILSACGLFLIHNFGSMGLLFVSLELNGIFLFLFLFSLICIFERYLRFDIVLIVSRYSFAAFLIHHVLSTNTVSVMRKFLDNSMSQSVMFVILLLVVFLLSFSISGIVEIIVKNLRSSLSICFAAYRNK